MVVSVVIAFGFRVMTAGVIGANIGAGLFIILGVPLCVGVVCFAAASYRRAARVEAATADG